MVEAPDKELMAASPSKGQMNAVSEKAGMDLAADKGQNGPEPGKAQTATLMGVGAILFWSSVVGFIRLVAQCFGPLLGAALLYTVASVFLWIVRGPKDVRSFPRKYVLVCGGLFVAYEVLFSLSIGLAASPQQSVEVSILNYLWPSLTVLFVAISSRSVRNPALMGIGLLAATIGVAAAVGGDAGLDFVAIASNIGSNPLPYFFAFTGTILWAAYSTLTPLISEGHDGITVFFTCVAVTMWVVWALAGAPAPAVPVDAMSVGTLLVAGSVDGLGYMLWNAAIIRGNMKVLSCASYATPVLSSFVATLLLGVFLTGTFWAGVAAVAAGSILTWLAQKK